MSERHKEALAHLTYGLGDVGGFALLTGEVGTGKTTISRRLMEQLPDNTQAAFILNPMLSSQELLATLCDELKIRYRKTGASLKTLTDKIAEKLKKNNDNNINTLLIIDEAQHLQPEVLEQLRLLTNLETNTKKLLQVILIGQPELQQLLQRRDLRQLAQRITARYHLLPLTQSEQGQYIQHRLLVADCTRALFDKGALQKIHRLSQGVPRLTNLLCHSALLQAYNQNDSVVNKKIVTEAAKNVLGAEVAQATKNTNINQASVILQVLTVISCIGLMSYWWGQHHRVDEFSDVKTIALQSPDSGLVAAIPEENKPNLPKSQLIEPDKLTEDNVLEVILLNNSSAENSAEYIAKVADDTVLSDGKNTAVNLVKSHSKKINTLQSITAQPVTPVNEAVKASSKNINASDFVRKNKKISKNTITKSEDYTLTPIEGASNDLLARFQMAIDETHLQASQELSNNDVVDTNVGATQTPNKNSQSINDEEGHRHVTPLSQMSPEVQGAIPPLQFEQHIYASDGQGWVNVNGRDRYEGDYISEGLKLDKILPQQVILSYQGQVFSLSALTNWQ